LKYLSIVNAGIKKTGRPITISIIPETRDRICGIGIGILRRPIYSKTKIIIA